MIFKCKTYFTKVKIFLQKDENSKSEKRACQNVVAVLTSNLMEMDFLCQIVPR